MAEKGEESVADAEGFAVLALKVNVFKRRGDSAGGWREQRSKLWSDRLQWGAMLKC